MDATSIADRFYAGCYAEVVAMTVDGPALAFTDRDIPFVTGALAYVGRIEEARALLGTCSEGAGLDDVVAARFFLGVALCRAGRMQEGERELRTNLRAGLRHPSPHVRFYVFQGLACLRYFAGRMDRAARHSLRALRAAFQARFQYGRLLATDLRGHALVQLGVPEAGLQLLEQAGALARTLGLAGNASAVACAREVYAARVGDRPLAESIARLEELAAGVAAQDSYSKRSVELELARLYAFAGRSDAAWALLERMASRPVPDGDKRGRVRMLLAFCVVALLRHGRETAQQYALEARALAEGPSDLGLEAEVLAVELMCLGDEPSRLASLVEVRRRIGVAPALRAQFADRAATVVADALARRPSAVVSVVEAGYLGLLPFALGRSPGRLLFVAPSGSLVVGDHGNVRVVGEVGAAALRLLTVLGDGGSHEKEALVREVWGLRVYHPERHASLVHTAVSRLRALLVTAGHWIEVRAGAYRLADRVVFVGEGVETLEPAVTEAPSPELAPAAPVAPSVPAASTSEDAEDARIRGFLRREGPTSSTAVARALKVSEMTALRRLQALAKEGLVIRTGKARATRYAVAPSSPEGVGSRP